MKLAARRSRTWTPLIIVTVLQDRPLGRSVILSADMLRAIYVRATLATFPGLHRHLSTQSGGSSGRQEGKDVTICALSSLIRADLCFQDLGPSNSATYGRPLSVVAVVDPRMHRFQKKCPAIVPTTMRLIDRAFHAMSDCRVRRLRTRIRCHSDRDRPCDVHRSSHETRVR